MTNPPPTWFRSWYFLTLTTSLQYVLNFDPVLSTCPEDGGDTFLRNVGKKPEPHGATPQKKTFCIVTAVKTSNLNFLCLNFMTFHLKCHSLLSISASRSRHQGSTNWRKTPHWTAYASVFPRCYCISWYLRIFGSHFTYSQTCFC
jgi:hypothetical protein